MNHTLAMLVACLLSGVGSTMNVWAAQAEDIRLSVNDLFMIVLMTAWMFFFMGVFMGNRSYLLWGGLGTAVTLFLIRTQFGVSETEYLKGMIPHHSMAVHLSRRLQEKPNTIGPFLEQLVKTQEGEIEFMKQHLAMKRPLTHSL
jgi:hypothetical protein